MPTQKTKSRVDYIQHDPWFILKSILFARNFVDTALVATALKLC